MTQTAPSDYSHADDHLAELTPNQRRALDLIVAGKTNAQIGQALGMTLDGAKWNVSEILTKLGFASREEVAAYWRSRRRVRPATERFRALVSIPAVGWAAAGIAIVAVVAIGIAVLSGGRDAPSTGSVAPFYIEAIVTQYVEPDDSSAGTVAGVGTGRTIRSRQIVRWWHRDKDHARFEFEQTDPPLSASLFTMILDGTKLVAYSSTDNSYEIQQPPPASSTAGGFFWPGKTILFGPSIEPSIPKLLNRLSHWNEGPVDTGPASAFNLTPLPVPTPTPPGLYGPAVKVGETDLLGRRVVVLERSPGAQ